MDEDGRWVVAGLISAATWLVSCIGEFVVATPCPGIVAHFKAPEARTLAANRGSAGRAPIDGDKDDYVEGMRKARRLKNNQ